MLFAAATPDSRPPAAPPVLASAHRGAAAARSDHREPNDVAVCAAACDRCILVHLDQPPAQPGGSVGAWRLVQVDAGSPLRRSGKVAPLRRPSTLPASPCRALSESGPIQSLQQRMGLLATRAHVSKFEAGSHKDFEHSNLQRKRSLIPTLRRTAAMA
jgi:hypothetical protein